MSDLTNSINKALQDQKFKKEFDKSELEYQITRTLIAARIEKNMTQQGLAIKSGVRQSNISRIENGTAIPTLETLKALAKGLDKELVISFK